MAVDGGYGPKGYPKFDPLGAPELNVDDEAVGAFAAKVGNRRVGPNAVRATLSTDTTVSEQRWPGMEYYETDTGRTYLHRATGFERISNIRWGNQPPVGATGEAFPADDTDPIFISGFGRIATLNGSGGGALVFPTAFPNGCLFFSATTIEGSAVNPVINNAAGSVTKTGVNLVWSGGAGVTVRFIYFAIGV